MRAGVLCESPGPMLMVMLIPMLVLIPMLILMLISIPMLTLMLTLIEVLIAATTLVFADEVTSVKYFDPCRLDSLTADDYSGEDSSLLLLMA
jgi:hypothetical protein